MRKDSVNSFGLGESAQQSNSMLIRRMLALAWKYRWGCIGLLAINVFLLSMNLMGLSLMGVGIDYIRYEIATNPAHASIASTQAPASDSRQKIATAKVIPKPPKWPLGIRPHSDWTPLRVLVALAAGILALALARAVLNFGNTILTNVLTQGRIVVDLRARVYAKMQQLSFRFFDTNTSGSLINRVTGDVQSLRQFIDGVVIQVFTLVLALSIYLVYMLRINAGLTAVCLASTPLLWLLTLKFSRTVKPAYRKNRELFDSLILALSENIQGAHVVKGFARQGEEIARFRKLNDHFRDQQFWIFGKVSTFRPLIGFLTNVNIMIMLAYGGYLVVQHELANDPATAIGLSIGQLMVFTSLLQQFSAQVAGVTDIANNMQQSLIGAQRVFEVLDTPVEIQSPAEPVRLPRSRGQVCFNHVSFAYDKDDPVLKDLTFTVEPGQCAAILGQTGSGKTTLLNLISRFYDPTSGSVMVDGTDVRQLDVHDLRRNIGMVFQESFLFSNTVAANIAFGHPDATREQIERAAKIACAHDFVAEMPEGYDTILHEGGINLSGGQRQRLAIARAILLEPVILLLDDPTASVDPATEKEIMAAVENAMEGRTTFIVAHRLSTLKQADRVIVLQGGRVVQSGTHDELIHTHGYYQSAAILQTPDEESLRLLEMKGGLL